MNHCGNSHYCKDIEYIGTNVHGNVPQLLVVDDTLVGDEAIITVDTLIEGHQIEGIFTLQYNSSISGNTRHYKEGVNNNVFRMRERPQSLQDWLYLQIQQDDLFDVNVNGYELDDGVGGSGSDGGDNLCPMGAPTKALEGARPRGAFYSPRNKEC